MDKIQQDTIITVIGATDRPEALNPMLLSRGRFDHLVEIPLPNLEEIEALLDFFNGRRPVDNAVNYRTFARALYGCNVAEVQALGNQAAQIAMRTEADYITREHFEQALQFFRHQQLIKQKNYREQDLDEILKA